MNRAERLLLPSVDRNDEDPEADFEAQKALTPWTSAWNVTGMPAISLPLHWTPDGLPVGVMLAARPVEEELGVLNLIGAGLLFLLTTIQDYDTFY